MMPVAPGVWLAMGLMRLTVHDRDRIPPGGLGQVYMCGQDELPWYGRAYLSGNQLIVERAESDSGCVFVPWRINGRGVLLLGTSTLMERDGPIGWKSSWPAARSSRLRNQIAQWELLGLVVPDELRDEVLEATRALLPGGDDRKMLRRRPNTRRMRSLAAVDAMDRSASLYAEQAIEMRRSQIDASSPRGSASTWASEMPAVSVARQLLPAFNMVSVPLSWRSIEASEGRREWKQADAQIEWGKNGRHEDHGRAAAGARRPRRARLDLSLGRRLR